MNAIPQVARLDPCLMFRTSARASVVQRVCSASLALLPLRTLLGLVLGRGPAHPRRRRTARTRGVVGALGLLAADLGESRSGKVAARVRAAQAAIGRRARLRGTARANAGCKHLLRGDLERAGSGRRDGRGRRRRRGTRGLGDIEPACTGASTGTARRGRRLLRGCRDGCKRAREVL